MNAVRPLGLGVAVVGVLFVIVGIESAHVPLAQFAQAVAGNLAHDTMLYITGGLAAISATIRNMRAQFSIVFLR